MGLVAAGGSGGHLVGVVAIGESSGYIGVWWQFGEFGGHLLRLVAIWWV